MSHDFPFEAIEPFAPEQVSVLTEEGNHLIVHLRDGTQRRLYETANQTLKTYLGDRAIWSVTCAGCSQRIVPVNGPRKRCPACEQATPITPATQGSDAEETARQLAQQIESAITHRGSVTAPSHCF